MSAFELRPYDLSVIQPALELAQVTLGNSGAVRKSEEFWRWKHHDNPFGESFGLCAWAGPSQLIGLRMMLRWCFIHPTGATLPAVRAVDTATHAGFRRMGVFSTLTRQMLGLIAAAGIRLVFNTPNRQSLPGYLKLGWQTAAHWPLFVRPLHPWRILTRKLMLRRHESSLQPGKPGALLTWQQFTAEFETQVHELVAISEASRPSHGWRTLRSSAYLEWRYGRHPAIEYWVYPWMANGHTSRLHGFAVVRPNVRFGLQEAVLVELVLAEWCEAAARRCLVSFHKALQTDYVIAHFAANSVERKALAHVGYLQIPRRRLTFVVYPLGALPQPADHPHAWDLTLGDLELF